MRNSVLARVAVIFILGLSLFSEAFAQGGATGAISGTVQDVTGAVVAGAQVQIINQDTGAAARTVRTDANGGFSAPLLPVATFWTLRPSPSYV